MEWMLDVQESTAHTFGIEPTTPIRWHFSGHPSS